MTITISVSDKAGNLLYNANPDYHGFGDKDSERESPPKLSNSTSYGANSPIRRAAVLFEVAVVLFSLLNDATLIVRVTMQDVTEQAIFKTTVECSLSEDDIFQARQLSIE